MLNSRSTNLIFLFLFAFIHTSRAYTVNGNTIYDLETTTQALFIVEASSWTASPGLVDGSTKVSTCWGSQILGGHYIMMYPQGYWEKTYSTPQSHNTLSFSLKIYQIDDWEPADQDSFQVQIDNAPIIQGWTLVPSAASEFGEMNSCGSPIKLEMKPIMFYVTMPHSSSTLQFRVYTKFNSHSNGETLGFRDLTLELQTLATPPSSTSFCGRTAGNPLPYNWCSCEATEYMVYPQSGYCLPCDSSCATCSGSSTNCASCNAGFYLSGGTCLPCDSNCPTCSGSSTTCTSCNPSWFMVGTTCYPTCTSPLYSATSGGVTRCYTPCLGQYVNWDGSCDSSCSYSSSYSSFAVVSSTESTFLRCDYPCATTQFLYWNSSCLNSCPEPLTTLSFKSRNFCSYTCPPNEFLFWNKTCLPNCPYPLTSELQGTYMARQFCWYPCMPWQWLRWDQTCQETCNAPLWPEVRGMTLPRQFCWYPCSSENKFLYWNTSCLSECPEPLTP